VCPGEAGQGGGRRSTSQPKVRSSGEVENAKAMRVEKGKVVLCYHNTTEIKRREKWKGAERTKR